MTALELLLTFFECLVCIILHYITLSVILKDFFFFNSIVVMYVVRDPFGEFSDAKWNKFLFKNLW